MQDYSESERIVLRSERIVLECRCGERLVLLGREEDWYSEGRAVFECDCGGELTLAHHFYEAETKLVDGFGEEATSIRQTSTQP